MTWTTFHNSKVDAVETVIRVLKNAKKLNDYAALEAALQAARAIAIARDHPTNGPNGKDLCPGDGKTGDCPLCQSLHFIEAALQAVNPDPKWRPRMDPDLPRIVLPGTV